MNKYIVIAFKVLVVLFALIGLAFTGVYVAMQFGLLNVPGSIAERNAFFTGRQVPGRDILDITWHGVRLNEPAWHDGSTQFLAYTIAGLTSNEEDLHVILNMADLSIEAPLPPVPRRQWYLAVDTFEHTTGGILWPENQRPALAAMWRAQPRSVLIFESRVGEGASI